MRASLYRLGRAVGGLRHLATDRRDRGDGHHDAKEEQDADVSEDEWIRQLKALDHHGLQGLVGVGQRQHRGARAQVVRQLRDRNEQAGEEDLRQQHDRDELNGLQLVARGGGDEQAQRHRADDHHRFDQEDRRQVPAVLDLQDEARERDDHERLQEGEDAEAREVADDELTAAKRRGHEPLERATRALAQERDRRQQEDEEEREERD